MHSNNLSMYLSEEKLLLHVSKYYIIFNCESCVLLCTLLWASLIHHQIRALSYHKQKLAAYCKRWNKSLPLPGEVSFLKADRDKTEAETMSWALSVFSLSVARKTLFGLLWQASFSLHSLSPPGPSLQPRGKPSQMWRPRVLYSCTCRGALEWWCSRWDVHHLF